MTRGVGGGEAIILNKLFPLKGVDYSRKYGTLRTSNGNEDRKEALFTSRSNNRALAKCQKWSAGPAF